MKVLRDDDGRSSDPCVVAIGVFDGLHRGHQAVLERLVELAERYDARATVVTFDPPPAMVLAPDKAPRMLATFDQRLEGLAALGVEQVRVLTFTTDLAVESARDFIERVLVGELRARAVIVGENFRFGHNREGSVALLREVGEERGFAVEEAPLVGAHERFSSTAVRRALDAGDVASAEAMTGHPFCLRGVVVHGDERGAELGFRTANLAFDARQLVPAEGVYAGASEIDGVFYAAAISVGTRPQFYAEGEMLVEAHVLNFAEDLYDRTLDLVFLTRLRDQSTFASVEDLTAQIERDVVQTKAIFQEFSPFERQLLR